MREDKIFKAVKGVDDDLICEMLEYSPEEDVNGDVSEGVMYSVPAGKRKATMRLWRYPVTAAAALAIAVGALFVINNVQPVSEDLKMPSSNLSEQTEERDKEEVSTDDNASSEETQPPVEETSTYIVPLKVVKCDEPGMALFTDLYPTIPQYDLEEAYFTEMSTLELFKYYGFSNVVDQIEQGYMIELTDENTVHGIYAYPNGDVYDINTFNFQCLIGDGTNFPHEFSMTIGKKKHFGQDFYCDRERNPYITYSSYWCHYYNETDEVLFSVDEYNGCSVMLFGEVYKIVWFDNPWLQEWLIEKDEEYRSKYDLPLAHIGFTGIKASLFRPDTDYFDKETGE